jgi:hypothetical protein
LATGSRRIRKEPRVKAVGLAGNRVDGKVKDNREREMK